MDGRELDLPTELALQDRHDPLGQECLHARNLENYPSGGQNDRQRHDNIPQYLECLSHNLQIYQITSKTFINFAVK